MDSAERLHRTRSVPSGPPSPFEKSVKGTVVWSTAGGTRVSIVIGTETRVRVFVWKPSVHLFWESRMRVVLTGSP
jgi:hypothetical protein